MFTTLAHATWIDDTNAPIIHCFIAKFSTVNPILIGYSFVGHTRPTPPNATQGPCAKILTLEENFLIPSCCRGSPA